METAAATEASQPQADIQVSYKLSDILTFLLPSAVGILLFIVPVRMQETYTIPIGAIASYLQRHLQGSLSLLVTLTILTSFALSLYGSLSKNPFPKLAKARQLFQVKPVWLVSRALAAVFASMAYWQWGFAAIYSAKTAGLVLHELLPTIFCMFLTAGFLLALLTDFGLLEFVGVLMSKFMRPLFRLPGRAAVDCLASWLGDGSIGILLTNSQYVGGYYTAREAAIIATSFSFVSLSFSLVILAQLQLMAYIFPFYLAIVLVGLVCALILPRIPPLSRKEDTYFHTAAVLSEPLKPQSWTQRRWAFYCAVERAKGQKDLRQFFQGGVSNVAEMWFTVIPVVLVFGTVALLCAEYTPLFSWLGLPFKPLLELLGLTHAQTLSQAVVVGFADMFLPAVFVSGLSEELPRFVIAALSVSQLIFMSEVGGLILGSKLPVTFKDLLSLFLLRTLIALPLIAFIAHRVFA